MKNTALFIVGVMVCAVAVFLVAKQLTPPKFIYREVKVNLSKEDLDSLELAFRVKFQSEIKPKIVFKTGKVVSVEDTSRISAMLAERDSLRRLLMDIDSLSVSEIMEKDTLIGKYQDSLRVMADCISGSMEVDFKPNPREFSVKDTVEVGGSSFIRDAGLFMLGVAVKTGIDGLRGK